MRLPPILNCYENRIALWIQELETTSIQKVWTQVLCNFSKTFPILTWSLPGCPFRTHFTLLWFLPCRLQTALRARPTDSTPLNRRNWKRSECPETTTVQIWYAPPRSFKGTFTCLFAQRNVHVSEKYQLLGENIPLSPWPTSFMPWHVSIICQFWKVLPLSFYFIFSNSWLEPQLLKWDDRNQVYPPIWNINGKQIKYMKLVFKTFGHQATKDSGP